MSYTHEKVIRPNKLGVWAANSSAPFVVLEARDEDEALCRALLIEKELGLPRWTSATWDVLEYYPGAGVYCPIYAAEYFFMLDAEHEMKINRIH